MQSDLTKFYEKQISLTEWFEAIGHPQAAKLRLEDNDKRERLDVLNRIIGLPFDKPAQFTAQDVAKRSPAFKKYLAVHGDELCAIRLIPTDPSLPKLRMRGHTIHEALKWFDQQTIDPAAYRVDFVPHFKPTWSTIFIVNKDGVFGDITTGWHYKLTQGTPEGMEAVTFRYDFADWQLGKDLPDAKAHLQDVLKMLKVSSPKARTQLQNEMNATFANEYLCGYFETTYDPLLGTMFIDYNRMLTDLASDTSSTGGADALVTGRCGSPGKASGTVRIVLPQQLETAELQKGDILVCQMTTPDYLPLMQQAAAIVTDLGGVLSHAAIIARELKKPCITGSKDATTILKDGQHIVVDADSGTITAA